MSANRDRRRGAPQGRSPLHHRQGPLHRRHQPARPDLRLFPPLAARARHDQSRSTPRRPPAMPGVLAVLTGAELAADKIGNLICGWMIHSKDGSPMKMAAHPALANGKACHVGDPVAVVIAETLAQARDAAEKVKVDYERAAGGRRSGGGAEARRAANPRRRAEQHHLSVASRRRQSGRGGVQVGQARHQARHRQQSPGAERDRAARRDRRLRFRHRHLHAVEHDAESACGAARHRRLRRHGAGAQAARDRARRRRRLRLEDFHLSRRSRGAVGVEARRPAGEMGLRPLGSVPRRRAWPRSRHPCRDGVRRRRQDLGAARQDHRQSRRLHVDLLVVGADLSLRDAAVGPVRHSADLLRGRRGLYQYRAGRRLSRRRTPGSDLRGRAAGRSRRARNRAGSGGAAAQEFRQDIPAPDAGDHELRRRRL